MTDDTYRVERSVRVDAPPERVCSQIADFRRWRGWSPWEGLDPNLEATVPTEVRIDLVFEKPFKAPNDTAFVISPSGAEAVVTWSMTGRRTLATRVMGVFKSMDDFVGPDFERGLAQLKATAEQPLSG